MEWHGGVRRNCGSKWTVVAVSDAWRKKNWSVERHCCSCYFIGCNPRRVWTFGLHQEGFLGLGVDVRSSNYLPIYIILKNSLLSRHVCDVMCWVKHLPGHDVTVNFFQRLNCVYEHFHSAKLLYSSYLSQMLCNKKGFILGFFDNAL